jgi:plasmid stabilization system protein ParE
MAKVIWSPDALDDLDAVAAYIARDSVDHAALLASRVIEATLPAEAGVGAREPRAGRTELALLNPAGTELEVDTNGAGLLSTDARAVYLDTEGGNVKSSLAVEGTHLTLGKTRLFRSWWRRTHERR